MKKNIQDMIIEGCAAHLVFYDFSNISLFKTPINTQFT